MSKTITVTVYRFRELSADAQQRALIDAQSADAWGWAKDYLASLKALVRHFGGALSDYSIDWAGLSPSYATFDITRFTGTSEESHEQWLADKLAALGDYNPDTFKGLGDCKLTGFCGDEDAIDGLRQAYMAGERDLNQLMQAAFDSWLKAAQADYADYYSVERYAEHADANNYWFTEDGEYWSD